MDDDDDIIKRPTLVSAIYLEDGTAVQLDARVVDVACGAQHTVVVLSEERDVPAPAPAVVPAAPTAPTTPAKGRRAKREVPAEAEAEGGAEAAKKPAPEPAPAAEAEAKETTPSKRRRRTMA